MGGTVTLMLGNVKFMNFVLGIVLFTFGFVIFAPGAVAVFVLVFVFVLVLCLF